MGFIKEQFEKVKKKYISIVEPTKLYGAFKKLPNSIEVRVLKNNRKVEVALRHNDEKTLRFFKEVKYINKNDIIVDERNVKYFVYDILIDQPFDITIDGETKTVETIVIKYGDFKDEMSLVEQVSQITNVTSTINLNIESVNNSTFQDFAKAITQVNQTQDIHVTWRKLEHDLDYRFDYEKYTKLRQNISQTIEKKDLSLLKKDEWDKMSRTIGSLLGSLLASFLVTLVEQLNK